MLQIFVLCGHSRIWCSRFDHLEALDSIIRQFLPTAGQAGEVKRYLCARRLLLWPNHTVNPISESDWWSLGAYTGARSFAIRRVPVPLRASTLNLRALSFLSLTVFIILPSAALSAPLQRPLTRCADPPIKVFWVLTSCATPGVDFVTIRSCRVPFLEGKSDRQYPQAS
jgi:hypothetical protein